jgi:hypothetical protein
LNWAIAGRSHTKLTAVADEIKQLNDNRKEPDIVVANSDDLEALTLLAKSTKALISCAGPFAKFIFLQNTLTTDSATNSFKPAQKTGRIMQISREKPLGISNLFARVKLMKRVRQIIQKYHQNPAPFPSILIPSCGVVYCLDRF